MSSPNGEAFATASGLFQECKEVPEFIQKKVLPQLSSSKLPDRAAEVLYGQLLRAYSWLRTITKLNEPSDFQAVAAGTRALFETTIDMVLLHATPSEFARVVAWEDSVRFKHAEAIERYYQGQGSSPPPEHEPAVRYATCDRPRIEQLRLKQGWQDNKTGKPRHPERWTGRNLGEDAKQADRHGHEFKFSQFYETEYRQVCWNVHGSAFVLRGVSAEDFPAIGGLLYLPCADLGTLCAELAIRHVMGWTITQEREFAALRTRRVLVAGMNMRITSGLPPIPEIPPR